MKKYVYLILVSLITLILLVPLCSARPATDILTFTVITGPAARLAAMTGTPRTADVWPSLSVPMGLWSSPIEEENGDLTPARISTLSGAGAFIAQDPGYHVGAIVYNIRADQSYRRPGISYWPLKDVEFRHALIHCYDQMTIIPTLYGYIVSPVQSLVPTAQSAFTNPAVPKHPYNPGNPFTSPAGEHSTCGILKVAGYVFIDMGTPNVVDSFDYWICPDGSPLPRIDIDSPLAVNAPNADAHVGRFITSLGTVGLEANTNNTFRGLIQMPGAFDTYLSAAYNGANFDAFFTCYGLDRVPDQLYSLLHSSQDSFINPGQNNAPGINDATIDALAETVKYSFDMVDISNAAKEIQYRLYDPTLPNADNFALAYMCMYSRSHFNAYVSNLQGIVKSPGYGADNKWTFLNINWASSPRTVGTSTQVIWMLEEAPSTFNPLVAGTKYDWEILARVYDGLTNVNPYNHYDIPWVATDWKIKERAWGMDVNFTVRDDVYWQDGYHVNASNIKFSLEALRDYGSINWADSSEKLIGVTVINPYKVTVSASEAGLSLFYSYAGSGLVLPPQIYDRPWGTGPLPPITAYNPDTVAYGTDMAPGYGPGPWASQVPTNLFGTGPWIFQSWNAITTSGDLYANTGYFLTTEQINGLKKEMFWEVGDYTAKTTVPGLPDDGIVNVIDFAYVAFAVGLFCEDPGFDSAADFNENCFVGITDDLAQCIYHLLWQREYP